MWPREGARQVPGLGGSAEGRARRWRSSGSRGNSGSGDRAARLDQQATRGAFVVHKEGLRSLGGEGVDWRDVRTDGANGGTAGLEAGARAREERSGAGLYARGRSVGGRWGHDGGSRTRGEAGAWPATCAAPAANGVPRAVRRPVDQRHLARPTCHGRHG
jgi:hypothetical protein